jgi:hypothetical protein
MLRLSLQKLPTELSTIWIVCCIFCPGTHRYAKLRHCQLFANRQRRDRISGTVLASWDAHAANVAGADRQAVIDAFEGYFNFWNENLFPAQVLDRMRQNGLPLAASNFRHRLFSSITSFGTLLFVAALVVDNTGGIVKVDVPHDERRVRETRVRR